MRVAIVNDLALAREALRRLVLSRPGWSVAWLAEDGAAAVRLAGQDRPDVILMDLVMPGTDGVEATRQIMATSPCPILVVTATVAGNYAMVLRAMSYGALDAVRTPEVGPDGRARGGQELLARLERLRIADCGLRIEETKSATPATAGPSAIRHPQSAVPLVALGASTGGPAALARVLEALPPGLPAAVAVVQHIDVEFATGLAEWLRGQCRLPVEVAREGSAPRAGVIAVAASNDHLVLRPDGRFGYTPEPADYPFRPSVDVFFESLAAHWPRPGVAVLLTGMWTDGARGLLALRQAGWLTIAQDEATSVVYGMPRAAAEINAASRVLPLPEIAGAIQARLER
jgi:two-component system response regulator WspF